VRDQGVTLAEFRRSHNPAGSTATDVAGAAQAVANTGRPEWAVLFVAVGPPGYSAYLAWDAWDRLRAVLLNPGSPDFMVISLAIQVVVPLLPPPAYLAVGLSRRREASWFRGAGVLCVLGLITALIEVGVDVLG